MSAPKKRRAPRRAGSSKEAASPPPEEPSAPATPGGSPSQATAEESPPSVASDAQAQPVAEARVEKPAALLTPVTPRQTPLQIASRTRWKPLAIAAAAALAVVVVLLAVFRPGGSANSPDEARFVGSSACAACHRAQHDAWQRSHHAHAMQAATETTVRGRFDGTKFRYAGVDSSFLRRDERFVVRTDGPGGKVGEFDVRYTFGIDPLQQYLVELPGGKLQALPFAWDTRAKDHGGARWFHLYPLDKVNYRDDVHWTRRSQNWNFMCGDCHAVDLRKNYDASNDTYRSTWAELGVGCESCHGPGSLHIAWAQKRGGDPSKGLTIALDERRNARWTIDSASGRATRAPERRADTEIEACAPCHSRRSQLGEGWQAGKRFLDFYRPVMLEPALYYADGQPRDQVFEWGSFVQSRMYRQGVTCGDCHEPHGGGVRAQGNALCAQCHAAAKYDVAEHHHHPPGAGAQCTGCHMPTTTFMSIDARHDHSMRVPRPDLSIALGTPNACNGCHTRKSPQWADEATRGWYGRRAEGLQRYAAAFAYAERATAEAGRHLAVVARDLSQPAFARASALRTLARFPSAQAIETAKRAVGDADALVRAASIAPLAALPPSERWSALSPLLADPLRSIRIDAAAALADGPGAASDAQFQRAASEYEAMLRYTADRPETRVALGTFYARLKRAGDADAAFRAAIALDPSYVPAYVEFADAFRLQDRDADAARVLREGLARAPDDPSLHHAHALALVGMKRVNEGLAELARATQLAPADAHLAYVYAVALNAHGRTPLALREIDRALARHPDDRDLLAAAVTFRRDSGDAAGAARFARRFAGRYPDDPQAQRLMSLATAR